MYNLIVILGPTASGKTQLATRLAFDLNSEIISADSRQVYKGMNIGTGKDLNEYIFNDMAVPYLLIDIKEAGESYNVSEFQLGFQDAFKQIIEKKKIPILCGGTGMYIDAILKNYQYTSVPKDLKLQLELSTKTEDELLEIFQQNTTQYSLLADISTRKRLERAIQISLYLKNSDLKTVSFPEINPLVIGIDVELEKRRTRITNRLKYRLENGLIEEVQQLLKNGISADKLIFYGLEYKFVTQYLIGQMSFVEMFEKLNVAIHQFAKRQMTYFRKMERDGIKIHWLDAETETFQNIDTIKKHLWNQ